MRSLRIASLSVALLASSAPPSRALCEGVPPGLSQSDLDKLVQALRGQPERPMKVRLQSALILGRAGRDPAVPALRDCLRTDPDHAVRAACALALGNVGAAGAVETLVEHLDEENALVREECRRALIKLARPEALPSLQAARERGSVRVRLALAEVAAAIPGREARDLLCELLGDPDEPVRAQAQHTLEAMAPAAALAVLLRGLEYPALHVRAACARISGLRRHTEAIPRLSALATGPLEAPEVQSAARGALREMRDALPVAALGAEARDGRLAREDRARALLLLAVAGGEEALAACIEALSASDESIRATAAQALAELGDRRALEPLRAAGARSENARVARVIARAVASLERNGP